MNAEKLKMLMKFDKIKQLEDFYNYHKGSSCSIELYDEVSEQEMDAFVEGYFCKLATKKRQLLLNNHWALEGLQAIMNRLLHKDLKDRTQKTRVALTHWRLKTIDKTL